MATLTREGGKSVIKILDQRQVVELVKEHEEMEKEKEKEEAAAKK